VTRVVAGERLCPDLPPDDFHELLDWVDGRNRAIVAMLLERIPPGLHRRTVGLEARSLELRRQAILTRLDATRTGETDRWRRPR
jgi:hypothetical protein